MNDLLDEHPGMSAAYMNTVNTFFTDDLQAVLDLGKLDLLEIDLDWVKKMLADRKISAAQLLPYLGVYRQAVQLELGAQGAPITAWLNEYHGNNQGLPH